MTAPLLPPTVSDPNPCCPADCRYMANCQNPEGLAAKAKAAAESTQGKDTDPKQAGVSDD